MLAPNHALGGFVFTGVFASICGQNIFDSPCSMALAVVASLAPDIDNPRAPVGLVCLPISKYINRRYGHRTITHSLGALVLTTALFYFIGFHPLIWFFGFLSHLIFDMVTFMGVPLFYPIVNPCVIPGKAELRFRTGDAKAESFAFAFFMLTGSTMQPMMKQGFWTTYNSQFGTQKHLSSEFQKSKDLLEVEYTYTIGSEDFKGKGFAVEADEKKTVLLQGSKFLTITPDKMNVKSIIFAHTKKSYKIETLNFIQISVDSLNSIVTRNPLIECDIQANQTAKISEMGIVSDFRNFKRFYVSDILFYAKDTTATATPFFSLPSVTGKMKRNEIQSIRDEYEAKRKKWENNQLEITRLITDTTTNYILHDRILKRINELKNEKPPELDIFRIRNLEYEALISEQQDAMRTQMEYQKYLIEQNEKRSQVQKTVFSGYIKALVIQ